MRTNKTVVEVLEDHRMVVLHLRTQEVLWLSQDNCQMRRTQQHKQNQWLDKSMGQHKKELEVVEDQTLDHLKSKKKVLLTNLIKAKRTN